MEKGKFPVAIGHISEKATVSFASYREAKNGWLLLASMGIPAGLLSGNDGWLPNTKTSAWGKETGLDWNIPDIELVKTPVGYQIKSQMMSCEVASDADSVWKTVAEIITEYMDRVESGCWEVA